MISVTFSLPIRSCCTAYLIWSHHLYALLHVVVDFKPILGQLLRCIAHSLSPDLTFFSTHTHTHTYKLAHTHTHTHTRICTDPLRSSSDDRNFAHNIGDRDRPKLCKFGQPIRSVRESILHYLFHHCAGWSICSRSIWNTSIGLGKFILVNCTKSLQVVCSCSPNRVFSLRFVVRVWW